MNNTNLTREQIATLPVVRWDPPSVENRYGIANPEWYPFRNIPNATPGQARARGVVLNMRTFTSMKLVEVWVCDKNELIPIDCRYYCQGWGLGTYDNNINRVGGPAGYTVLSGFVHHVLQDPAHAERIVKESTNSIKATNSNPELNNLNLQQARMTPVNVDARYVNSWNIRAGDVVTWWGQNPIKKAALFFALKSNLVCMHTAVIRQPIFEPRTNILGQVEWCLSRESRVSSKNGVDQFIADTTLGAVLDVPLYRMHNTIGIYRLKPRPAAIPQPPQPNAIDAAQHSEEAEEDEILEMTANEHQDPPIDGQVV